MVQSMPVCALEFPVGTVKETVTVTVTVTVVYCGLTSDSDSYS